MMENIVQDTRAEETEIFRACENFNDARDKVPAIHITPAAGVELARVCGRTMALLSAVDMPEEHFSTMIGEMDGAMGEDNLAAQTVGHFVMQALCDRVGMNLKGKKFLMEVATILGPDQLENLRRNVAFMIKVEGFN